MSLDESVSDLIRRIYCAREDVDAWDGLGQDVLEKTGACAALTTLVDLRHRNFDATRFYGRMDSNFARGIEEYSEIYYEDPTLRWASENPLARFCDSSRTVSGNYLEDAFIKWNKARFGSTHWYVGFTPPEEQLSYSFSIHFPADDGPGSAESLRLFRMLFDHMQCAVSLGRRPFNPESDAAFLLLDSSARVRELSRGARALLSSSAGLIIVDGRLRTARTADQARLEAAFAQSVSVASTGARPAALKLDRPCGARPWLLTIKPLISSFGPFGKVHCELLVHIHDGRPKLASLHLLKGLFSLTDREVEVLGRLAEGHSLETLAACLQISTNTVRAHLRSIFTKTGTSRQSEVLQLCADLASI